MSSGEYSFGSLGPFHTYGPSPLDPGMRATTVAKILEEAQKKTLEINALPIKYLVETCKYLPTVYKQFRFPRSRKRRIREKWRKDPANWRQQPSPDAFRIDGTIYCDERIMHKVIRRIQKHCEEIAITMPEILDIYETSREGRPYFVSSGRHASASAKLSISGTKLMMGDNAPVPEIKSPPAPAGHGEFLQMLKAMRWHE